MYRHIALSLLASCSLWTRHSRGLSVNRTIDDELGDVVTGAKPQYSPDGVWNQGTRCSSCHIGTSQVDVSQTFDGTWHDGTYFVGQPDIEVRATFTGTAVYVYFIVPGSLPSIFTFMNTTFFIDDEPVGQFTHPPDAAADISYRVPVYTNNTLANSEHTLLMRATGTNTSLILFDYIVYTAEALMTIRVCTIYSTSRLGQYHLRRSIHGDSRIIPVRWLLISIFISKSVFLFIQRSNLTTYIQFVWECVLPPLRRGRTAS